MGCCESCCLECCIPHGACLRAMWQEAVKACGARWDCTIKLGRQVPATNLRIVIPFCFVPQSTTNVHILWVSVPCVVMRDLFLMLAYLQVPAGARVKLCTHKSQLRLVTCSRQGRWWNLGGTRRKHERFHYWNSWSNQVSKCNFCAWWGPTYLYFDGHEQLRNEKSIYKIKFESHWLLGSETFLQSSDEK